MSLSQSEYLNGIEAFGGSEARSAALRGEPVAFDVGGGQALIAYRRLPDACLGGLLKLPRARITITFRGAAAEEQAAFVRRFDIAFQRGGG